MSRILLLIALACASCDDELAGVGQPCQSSGDCANGLLCDFGKKPNVCEPASSVSHDMAMPTADLSAAQDLSHAD